MDRQAIVQSSKAHPDQVPVGPVHRKGGERMRTGRSDVERSRKSQVTYLDWQEKKRRVTSINRASSSKRAQLTPCRQTTASAWLGHSVSCMLGKVDVCIRVSAIHTPARARAGQPGSLNSCWWLARRFHVFWAPASGCGSGNWRPPRHRVTLWLKLDISIR